MGAGKHLNVNTDVFRSVIEVDQCGSISHAAANLFMSQPNLSVQITRLERALGFPIFERSSAGVRATPQGRLFLESARIIATELDNVEAIAGMTAPDAQNLSIVCVYSVFVLDRYLRFRQAFPAGTAEDLFKETGLQSALDDMINRRYRLGFVYQLDCDMGALEEAARRFLLEFELLSDDIPLLAIMPRTHPLAARGHVPADELRDVPLVAFEYLRNANWLEKLGVEGAREVLYVYDRGGELEIARHGRHVCVSVGTPFLGAQNDSLVSLPITGAKARVSQFVMRQASYTPTPVEQRFLDFVRTEQLHA